MDMRGVDTDLGWINRELARLRREIEGLRSERRAAATTIGSGGLIIDGGDLVFIDDDGGELLRIGAMEFADRGFEVSRTDGSPAITVSKLFAASTGQELRVRDRSGNPLLTEEAVGSGPAFPIFSIPMQPIQATPGPLNVGPHGPEITTSLTSWTDVFRARFRRHNQYATFGAQMAASDTATTGEMRLINIATGDHLGQLFAGPYTATRSAGSVDYAALSLPALVMPGAPWESIALAVQVRRTVGTGSIRVALNESRGG